MTRITRTPRFASNHVEQQAWTASEGLEQQKLTESSKRNQMETHRWNASTICVCRHRGDEIESRTAMGSTEIYIDRRLGMLVCGCAEGSERGE